MMLMQSRLLRPVFIFYLVLMSLNYSCKKQDTIPPVIYHPDLQEGDQFTDGDTLLLHVTITDNKALTNYDYSIIPDSIDHLKWSGQYIISPFEYNADFAINGNTVMRNDSIFIDTGIAAGSYHLHLSAIDEAGLSTTEDISITVSSSKDLEAPTYTNSTMPDSVRSDSVFYFSDTLTDNIRLSSLYIELIPADSKLKTWSWLFFLTGKKETDPWALVAPPDAGTYTLKIYIRDWVNNKRSFSKTMFIY